MEPITIPRRCQLAWDALNGRIDYRLHLLRAGWYSTRDLFAVTGRPSTERKVRELRKLGLVDWRKVTDHNSGGEFVEFKVAAEPGRGREIVNLPAGDAVLLSRRPGENTPAPTVPPADTSTRQPSLSASPTVAGAPAEAAGELFYVEPDRAAFERGKRR